MQKQQKRRITSSSLSMGGKTRAIVALEAGEDEMIGDVARTPVKPMMQQKYNEADDNLVENPASTKTVKH